MNIIPKGEKESRVMSVNVDEQVVHNHHVTRHDDGLEYALDWKLDFSECSQEEILKLAAKTVTIGLRPEFKKCEADELEQFDNRTYDVKAEYLTHKTSTKGREKLVNTIKGMDEDTLRAILAERGIDI